MGNCLRRESPMTWAGEDWDFPATTADTKTEDQRFTTSSSTTSRAPATEVKIKITKKQLEELLGKVDVKELSVQQVLAQLMNVGDGYETHQRSWRPALQSIPEVNDEYLR